MLKGDCHEHQDRVVGICVRRRPHHCQRKFGTVAATGRQRGTSALFPVRQAAKYGYINRQGKLVVEPRFEDARPFSEGLGRVRDSGQVCFIDADGEIVIRTAYLEADDFSEGMAMVVAHFIKDFDFVGARALVAQFAGFIDRNGKLVVDTKFTGYCSFAEGLAAVEIEDKWGYIDRKGVFVIKPIYEEAFPFVGGLALVKTKKDYSMVYINRTGETVIDCSFDAYGSFSEGLAVVCSKDKWGYINTKGEVAIEPIYQSAAMFSEGMGIVELNGSFGYVDKMGKLVVEPTFSDGRAFREGRAIARYWVIWHNWATTTPVAC